MTEVHQAEDAMYEEPDYDIGDVRRALKEVYEEMRAEMQKSGDESIDEESLNASYCSVLSTLHKISNNMLRTPPNPSHLTLNLNSPAVQRRFGRYSGALKLLSWMGLEEEGSDGQAVHTMQMKLERLEKMRVRIERAAVIIDRVKEEHSPPKAEEDMVMDSDVTMNDAAVAPSSVFLANAEDGASGTIGSSSVSPPAVSDEEMKPDLQPTYNIAEVRSALNQLMQEVDATLPPVTISQPASTALPSSATPSTPTPLDLYLRSLNVRESFCEVLGPLIKVTQNLLRTPLNPAHLRINLANSTVERKFGRYAGAVAYLKFLGFKETRQDNGAEAESAATLSKLLSIDEELIRSEQIKLNRALSIIAKLREEATPTVEEVEQRKLGPVDREMRVFDMTDVSAEKLVNPSLPSPPPDDDAESSKGDLALLLAASAAERRRVHELARTDVIVTKQKQQEMRETMRRKYAKTLIKITFSDKTVPTMQQGHGRFGKGSGSSGSVRRGGGYVLGSKSPASSTRHSSEPSHAMEEEVEEEKKDYEMESESTLTPTAASSSSAIASPPTSPASTSSPPAELLISAYFRPFESLADLFLFVQSILSPEDRERPFTLQLPPNIKFQCSGHTLASKRTQEQEERKKALQQLGLVPAASLLFQFVHPTPTSPPPTTPSRSILSSIHPSVLSTKQSYDASLLASLVPQAENKAELDALKARQQSDMLQHDRAANPAAAAKGATLPRQDDDDDLDMEKYMRMKKARTVASAASRQTGGPVGRARPLGSSSSSSSSSGSAAAKRNIPGFFKPK